MAGDSELSLALSVVSILRRNQIQFALIGASELAIDDPDVASRLRAIFDTLPEALRRDVENFLGSAS